MGTGRPRTRRSPSSAATPAVTTSRASSSSSRPLAAQRRSSPRGTDVPAPRLNSLQLQMVAAVVADRSLTGVQAGWGGGEAGGRVFSADVLARTRVGGVIPWLTDSWPRIRRVVLPECRKWLPALGWVYATTEQ